MTRLADGTLGAAPMRTQRRGTLGAAPMRTQRRPRVLLEEYGGLGAEDRGYADRIVAIS